MFSIKGERNFFRQIGQFDYFMALVDDQGAFSNLMGSQRTDSRGVADDR
ncbi:MAG: hypothetical protein P8173_13845 [Gammaproteobacteria bacterium]